MQEKRWPFRNGGIPFGWAQKPDFSVLGRRLDQRSVLLLQRLHGREQQHVADGGAVGQQHALCCVNRNCPAFSPVQPNHQVRDVVCDDKITHFPFWLEPSLLMTLLFFMDPI